MELTATESNLIISLHRIVTDLDRKTKVLCQKQGLTFGQFMVLEALYHKGPLSVGEVKESILSTDGTIPVIVANMEKAGLLARKQDEKDRRKSILSLTKKGRDIIREVYPDNAEMIHTAFSVWNDREKGDLKRLLAAYWDQKTF
ncbi:MAG: MarR family transcriptional regulator [Lachnospiraceae bacterium]|uniref:MarR family winged helix-turn-helix transcriptional regulator n=1 Tax=Bilifractor sp. LCP21S3_A7 TaxID=3438738 RepID=UPI003055E30E|nr:MarR family transcriptional regulator [Lachnospiraceae bacterium]